MSQNAKQEIYHLESRGTIYSYFDFSLKPAVVSCLTNALAPPPIALESCSMAQTDQTVFPDCTQNFFGWGVRIFCGWRHKWSSF